MAQDQTVVDAGDALAGQTTTQTQNTNTQTNGQSQVQGGDQGQSTQGVEQQQQQQPAEGSQQEVKNTTNTNAGRVGVPIKKEPQKNRPLQDPKIPQNQNTESMSIQQQAEKVEKDGSLDSESKEEDNNKNQEVNNEGSNNEKVESNNDESNKEESKEQTENQEEDNKGGDNEPTESEDNKSDDEEGDDSGSDLVYIKNNPEQVYKLIQDLQKTKFSNPYRSKYEILKSEKEILEQKYNTLQSEKYDSKYDDSNLPVLEEKRGLRRSQNKFYQDTDNEANRSAYITRLKEELEDLQPQGVTVSTRTVKESSNKPDPKSERYSSNGRVGVRVKKHRR